MEMRFETRAGMTDPIVIQCKSQDPVTLVESVVDLTGVGGVELHLRRRGQTAVQTFATSGSQLTINSPATSGKVTYAPAVGDLVLGLYDGWLKVTDAVGKLVSFPSDSNFELDVIENY